jgi:hypothetical protein
VATGEWSRALCIWWGECEELNHVKPVRPISSQVGVMMRYLAAASGGRHAIAGVDVVRKPLQQHNRTPFSAFL